MFRLFPQTNTKELLDMFETTTPLWALPLHDESWTTNTSSLGSTNNFVNFLKKQTTEDGRIVLYFSIVEANKIDLEVYFDDETKKLEINLSGSDLNMLRKEDISYSALFDTPEFKNKEVGTSSLHDNHILMIEFKEKQSKERQKIKVL